MKMKLLILTVAVFTLALCPQIIFAQDSAVSSEKQIVNNKICPVDGEKIGSMEGEEAATVEHNGKVYNLCCAHCIEAFQKDADKFAKMAEDEATANSKEEENHKGHDDHEGHDHK